MAKSQRLIQKFPAEQSEEDRVRRILDVAVSGPPLHPVGDEAFITDNCGLEVCQSCGVAIAVAVSVEDEEMPEGLLINGRAFCWGCADAEMRRVENAARDRK